MKLISEELYEQLQRHLLASPESDDTKCLLDWLSMAPQVLEDMYWTEGDLTTEVKAVLDPFDRQKGQAFSGVAEGLIQGYEEHTRCPSKEMDSEIAAIAYELVEDAIERVLEEMGPDVNSVTHGYVMDYFKTLTEEDWQKGFEALVREATEYHVRD